MDQRGQEIGNEKRSCKNETARSSLLAGGLGDIFHKRILNGSVINSFQHMLKSSRDKFCYLSQRPVFENSS